MPKNEFRWLNIFVRDLILVGLVIFMQFRTNFSSKSIFLVTGMLMVLVTWHLSDYLNYKKWIGI